MRKVLTCFLGASMLSAIDFAPSQANQSTDILESQSQTTTHKQDSTIVEYINPLLITYNDDPLMNAMIQVESRGKDSVIGDNGKAIGILQMHKIAVRSVNKILKKNDIDLEYSYDDRYSREKTIEMYWIWRNSKHMDSDYETIARSWNGGPRGPNKSATLHYWNKVEKEVKNHHQKLMLVDGMAVL